MHTKDAVSNRMNLHLAGVKVRVYCQVGKANQGKFALDVAVKTLDLYKEYVNSHGIISSC